MNPRNTEVAKVIGEYFPCVPAVLIVRKDLDRAVKFELSDVAFTAMSPGDDGNLLLWGPQNLTLHFDGARFAPGSPRHSMEGIVISMLEFPGGVLWLGTRDGGLYELKNGLFTRVLSEAFLGSVNPPDITLMDLRLPGMDGFDAMTAILTRFPEAKIIVLTTYSGDAQILRALNAGARGYLLKDMLRRELLDAIRTVHGGRKRIPPEIATQIAEHAGDTKLTPREIEVLHLIAAGNSNKSLADKLSVSEETAKMHVKNILSKLGANDRTHAVTIAVKRRIMNL